jgi:hypothetical protein
MLTSAECRALAEQKLAEADLDRRPMMTLWQQIPLGVSNFAQTGARSIGQTPRGSEALCEIEPLAKNLFMR